VALALVGNANTHARCKSAAINAIEGMLVKGVADSFADDFGMGRFRFWNEHNKLLTTNLEQDDFTFSSGWYYSGKGDKQALKLSIEKTTAGETQVWNDEHPMVAFSFKELIEILKPYFEVNIFEHDYDKLLPWDTKSGNALIACVKI